MGPNVFLDGREERSLQPVGSFEQRNARAIRLGDFLGFLLAHLMRIFELLEKLIRVLDAIHAKVQVLDVLVTGPEPRRFIWRVAAIGRQREVGLGARFPRRFGRSRCRSCRGGLMPDDIETEYGSDQGKIDDAGSQIATDTGIGIRHGVVPWAMRTGKRAAGV